MVLTGLWMALAGLLCLGVAAASRTLRWPVIVAYLLQRPPRAALAARSWSSSPCRARERVGRAGGRRADAGPPASSSRCAMTRAARRARCGRGGGRVLTLTGFEVANGPDLRVYLVAGPAGGESEVASSSTSAR